MSDWEYNDEEYKHDHQCAKPAYSGMTLDLIIKNHNHKVSKRIISIDSTLEKKNKELYHCFDCTRTAPTTITMQMLSKNKEKVYKPSLFPTQILEKLLQ